MFKPELIAVDIETTGLNPWKDRILGVAGAWYSGGNLIKKYWPFDPAGNDAVPRQWLADPTITKLGHNLRFDVKFLRVNGVTVDGPWQDTKLLASLILQPTKPRQVIKYGLKPLARDIIGERATQHEQALKAHLKELKLGMSDLGDPRVNQRLIAAYCEEDVVNTLLLYQHFQRKTLNVPRYENLMKYYKGEMLPLERVLMEMELRGNSIDTVLLQQADATLQRLVQKYQKLLHTTLHDEISRLEEKMWQAACIKHPRKAAKKTLERPRFNWASGPQKRELFYGMLELGKYCTETTETGQPSLNRKTLAALKLPEGKLKTAIDNQILLQQYTKNLSTYVVGIRERLVNGVIHGEYYQASQEDWGNEDDEGGTATGRLSHRNPNLGNLPRAGNSRPEDDEYWRGTFVKDLFIPQGGYVFIHADYSQIELRVAAHLARDTPFIEAFNRGEDPHQQTATRLGITRQQAKTVNFLLIYFGSPWRLAFELGFNPHDPVELAKAERIHGDFFGAHPELLAWIHGVRREVQSSKYVTSMFGRERHLPDVYSNDRAVIKHALRQAGNFVVQSAAASVCKLAMIELHRRGFDLRNQVHDSIDVMVPREQAADLLPEVKAVMETIVTLSVPLAVDAKIINTFKE